MLRCKVRKRPFDWQTMLKTVTCPINLHLVSNYKHMTKLTYI